MKTIHKYALSTQPTTIGMPRHSEVLCVQMQNGVPHLWVLVEDTPEHEARRFHTYGTGWAINGGGTYIGTYQDGPYVWHVFEEPSWHP